MSNSNSDSDFDIVSVYSSSPNHTMRDVRNIDDDSDIISLEMSDGGSEENPDNIEDIQNRQDSVDSFIVPDNTLEYNYFDGKSDSDSDPGPDKTPDPEIRKSDIPSDLPERDAGFFRFQDNFIAENNPFEMRIRRSENQRNESDTTIYENVDELSFQRRGEMLLRNRRLASARREWFNHYLSESETQHPTYDDFINFFLRQHSNTDLQQMEMSRDWFQDMLQLWLD